MQHLSDAHTEWTSSKKTEESRKMTEHIALTCNLDLTQCDNDVVGLLPNMLHKPLVVKNIFQSFKCPFCKTWSAKSHSGSPDRDLHRHMKEKHKGYPSDVEIEGPLWTYRVSIYPQSLTHVFMLSEMWNLEDVNLNQPQSIVDISSLPMPSSSVQPSTAIAATQDWPIHLKWESYAAEIKAGEHAKQLRMLIRAPKVSKAGPSANFLEKGLHYVQQFSIKYMKGSGSMAKQSVTHLGRALVSQ
jgi:hypothetical protein